MKDLLVEIGTEELPAGVINPLLEYLKESFIRILGCENIKVYGTPRRLALYVENLPNERSMEEQLIVGPPKKVAYDEEGKPTKALLAFLERNQANIENLIEVRKGDNLYVGIKKVVEGKTPMERLQEEFESVLLSAPLPKSMRWDSTNLRFSRPIRWICALYGEEIVDIKFGKVKSDRKTKGHRFLSPGWIELKEAREYEQSLKENYVIPSYKERLEIILSELMYEAYSLGADLEKPEGLLEEVTNLVEYPVVLSGEFDEKYLELPDKVIVTVLAHHQRFFCLKKDGKLLNRFLAVSGNIPKDESLVVKGYQKVVKARLEDALFFYKEDLKVPLSDLVPKLSGVIFHPKAGTMLEKTHRLMEISKKLCEQLKLDQETTQKCLRAAYLSKADLLTNMVRELDELQGYMGMVYAQKQGEDPEVAIALYEQYLPKAEELPRSKVGLVLSLADKIDHVVSLLKVGEKPSGSSDPYGIRRAINGIFLLVEEFELDIDLSEFSLPEDFVRSRFENYLEKYGYDVARAVLEVCNLLKPLSCIKNAQEIARLKEESIFKDIVSAYRRVVRILPRDWMGDTVREELLTQQEEKELWETVKSLEEGCHEILQLSRLKEPIDRFFDRVLVMDPNQEIRENRLALLFRAKKLFNRFADFSQLVYKEEV